MKIFLPHLYQFQLFLANHLIYLQKLILITQLNLRGFKNGVLQFHMQDSSCRSPSLLSQFSPHQHQNHHQYKNNKNLLISEPKFPQYFISPAIGPSDIKLMGLHSPSPFKKPEFNYLEEQQYNEAKLLGEGGLKNQHLISQVLNLNQSPAPNKKVMEVDTIGRTPKMKNQIKKSSKGLRSLSESVYQIVLELKITTYKQVALRLVAALNQNGQKNQSTYRDEQNIKRRVYDALNVLISADVLKKRGKEVMIDNNVIPEKMRIRESLAEIQSFHKVDHQLEQKTMIVKEKKRKVEELRRRYEILSIIFSRNKKKKYQQLAKIYFPLLGISFQPSKRNIIMKHSNQQLIFKPNSLEQVLGDADLLMSFDLASHNIDEIMEAEVFEEDPFKQQN